MGSVDAATNLSNTVFDLVAIPLLYGVSALSFNVVLRDVFLSILPIMYDFLYF